MDINVEGNPVGPIGMQLLISAMSSNMQTAFKVNMKEISADKDIKAYKDVFDLSKPEKEYTLNMAQTYDVLILQSLLRHAEGCANTSEGKFDIKACFFSVKLNGKPNWNPPSAKDQNGNYEVAEKTGLLTFYFTTNPIVYKQTQAKLAALAESQPPAAGAPAVQAKPPNELLEIEFISKPIISAIGFERFVRMIGKCYQEEDEQNQEELVKNLSRQYMLWTRQALEILYSFKNVDSFAKIAPFLMNRVADRHNRFALFSHFPKGQRNLLSRVSSKMGKNAFMFNYWNPNGHYELNLAN